MLRKVNYSFREYVSDLAHYIKPYQGLFWGGVFFRLTSDMGRLYPSWAISRVVQILSDQRLMQSEAELSRIFLIWGVITLYTSFAHNFCKYLGYQVAESAALDLYKQALGHIFRLDFSWQEKEGSGNKMKRIARGQEAIDLTVRRIFNVIIEVVVNTIGIVVLFSTLDKSISVALTLYIISFFLIGTHLLKKAVNQERIVSKSWEDLEGLTFESLNNVQTIKSLAIDGGVLRLVNAKVRVLLQKIKRRIFLYQSQYGLMNSFANFFKYFTIMFLAFGVLRGTSPISLLVLFIGLFDKVDHSAGELAEVVQELSKAKIWMSRAKSILKTIPKIESAEKMEIQSPYDPNWKEIHVRNINFSYRKNPALNNISFDIKRQEKVGIVGLSGAGKSTLFKLFLDLYENYDGDILLDEMSLKNTKRQSYIDHVSVVLQDTELFNMSLKENIEIASVSRVKKSELLSDVIKMAHLEEMVAKLPQGINTIVGEKGIKLSGGQRQRVGIARALFRKPDILLLDEATSHLDTYSEKEIQKAIIENVSRFTAIVIAHRLSTIKAMDKIIVLEEGRVVEQGNFEELIEKEGVFARMWAEQKI